MKLVVDNSRKLILAFGGAGCSMLDALPADSPMARFYINTDDSKIVRNPEQCVLFSASRSLPAQVAEREAEINALLSGFSEVFMLVGLGGQAGSRLCLAFAELARSKGVSVRGFVTLPFSFEGSRVEFAKQTLASLQKLDCSMFLYDHELETKGRNGTLLEHFERAAEMAMGLLR